MRLIGLTTVAALTVILTACGSGPTPPPPAAQPGPLDSVVSIADERLETADTVTAVKWGTHGAVEDPRREQVVLDTAARGATTRGLAPPAVAAVFRDQIQANKVVQYGLLEDWTAEPAHAPATAPDLTGVRSMLDQVTPRLLDALAATAGARHGPDCAAQVQDAAGRVADARTLDALHRQALDRALRSVCT